VNVARHPRVKSVPGQKFIDWLLSKEGQTAIAGYRVAGQQLFFPNAARR
jgi:tungstate transport system substrate-binding protein